MVRQQPHLLSLRRTAQVAEPPRPEVNTGWRRAYGAGLATNLGNPKAGVFAISLLPGSSPGGSGLRLSMPRRVLGDNRYWYLLFTWVVGPSSGLWSRLAVAVSRWPRAAGCCAWAVAVSV